MRDWTSGNRLRLLENGEEFYPRLFEAIGKARQEILLETFIWFEDDVGQQLLKALVGAAKRGVDVRVLVDGYGTPDFSPAFLEQMTGAGIRVDTYDPQPTFLRIRTNVLCRLHRKLVVIDDELAFVGGINYSADHLRSFGEGSMQDYCVEVAGPAVREIGRFCRHRPDRHRRPIWKRGRYWLRRFPREMMHPHEDAQVLFAYRDNDQHPTDIETMYRLGIRNAKESIVIANAYFFPGHRFIRDLRKASRRGVDVTLILQGKPDKPLSLGAASILYEDLLSAGIRILHYNERPLHAKVAVIDRHWSTIGSSNLDPFSLGLNLEANLFVLDESFNATLRDNLDRLATRFCTEVTAGAAPGRSVVRRLLLTVGYHLTRRMWTWGRTLPYHEQRVRRMRAADTGEA